MLPHIKTLEELMRARAAGKLVYVPTVPDFKEPRYARDITALPVDVVYRLMQNGLYIYEK